MHTIVALAVALALMVWPFVPDDTAFCDWLDAVDTHWDVIASFSELVAYDSLAYPLGITQYVNARLIAAGCDY